MPAHKKAPSWGKFQDWFVEKLMDHQGGISPLGSNPNLFNTPLPRDGALQKQDYQSFLEAASFLEEDRQLLEASFLEVALEVRLEALEVFSGTLEQELVRSASCRRQRGSRAHQ